MKLLDPRSLMCFLAAQTAATLVTGNPTDRSGAALQPARHSDDVRFDSLAEHVSAPEGVVATAGGFRVLDEVLLEEFSEAASDVDASPRSRSRAARQALTSTYRPLTESEQALLRLTGEQSVATYFDLATHFGPLPPGLPMSGADVFYANALNTHAVVGTSPAQMKQYKNALGNARRAIALMRTTRDSLVREHPALSGYIDQALRTSAQRLAGPTWEGQSPDALVPSRESVLSAAHALQQGDQSTQQTSSASAMSTSTLSSTERLTSTSSASRHLPLVQVQQIRDFYALDRAANLLTVPLPSSSRTSDGWKLKQIADGELTFIGSDGFHNALQYAPRAVKINQGLTVPAVLHPWHIGPVDTVDDPYAPSVIRFEKSNFKRKWYQFEQDRYQKILLYGNHYSTSNGRFWHTNPHRTTPDLERAKFEAASGVIRAARRIYQGA